jgi:hypothetical protein
VAVTITPMAADRPMEIIAYSSLRL